MRSKLCLKTVNKLCFIVEDIYIDTKNNKMLNIKLSQQNINPIDYRFCEAFVIDLARVCKDFIFFF